jgi:DNA/RNA-binding domain of Phe-tRNA-synthetase-like protein
MRIGLDSAIAGKVHFEAFLHKGVSVTRFAPTLWEAMDALAEIYRNQMEGLAPAQMDELVPGRELYRGLGVDPTRRRLASEALLRRVLKGKGLYRINSAVDCANFCSLRFLLPIGLYDADRLEGDVVLRLGLEGEAYKGLGKDQVTLHGHLTLCDQAGPFGHPSGDSYRTRVELSSRNLLWVIFAPLSLAGSAIEEKAALAGETAIQYCGGMIEPIGD